MTYVPGLDQHPGDDDGFDTAVTFDSGATFDQPGVEGGVATPDPFGPADQAQYDQTGQADGVDVAIEYLPPWPVTRAPGTVRTVVAGEVVPIDPWQPVIALLNADQLALLNRESAARQAASFWVDDARSV